MLGVEGYGSDVDSDDETQTQSSSKTSLPPPKSNKRGPKKITIALPTLTDEKDDDLDSCLPPTKKPRLDSGAGVSSLLSMLPAPKLKNSVAPPPERVLGGGTGRGLDFRTARTNHETQPELTSSTDYTREEEDKPKPEPTIRAAASTAFIPLSTSRGRANVSLDEEGRRPSKSKVISGKVQAAPAVDFFSLGSTGPQASSSKPQIRTDSSAIVASVSSAPSIPTFEPPEPTRNDEYPGYYQLPSGAWAAYDAVYYGKFMKKWQKQYDDHVRALEKGHAKGFEGLDTERVGEVNAQHEMEISKREIKDREDKKALTMGSSGEAAKPKMKLTAAKQSGIARSRHQLATMLNEAYQNREALEEKIAEGRRNRKEAGNKYGF